MVLIVKLVLLAAMFQVMLARGHDPISEFFFPYQSTLGTFESAAIAETMKNGLFTWNAESCKVAGLHCEMNGPLGGSADYSDFEPEKPISTKDHQLCSSLLPSPFYISWESLTQPLSFYMEKLGLEWEEHVEHSTKIAKELLEEGKCMSHCNLKRKIIKAILQKCDPQMFDRFFTTRDMQIGAIRRLADIRDTYPDRAFLPQAISKYAHFGTRNLASYFKEFNVPSDSAMASKMKMTFDVCTYPGTNRWCAESLEDMSELIVSNLGSGPLTTLQGSKALSQHSGELIEVMNVSAVTKGATTVVSCHAMMFPYMVYYCHKVSHTSAFNVVVKTQGGTELSASILCHTDTSHIPSTQPALVVLDKMPGETESCHWFVGGTEITFVPTKNTYY